MHQHGEVCRFAAACINTLKFAARLQEVAGTSRPRDWEVVFASASGARSTGGRGASALTRRNGTLVDLSSKSASCARCAGRNGAAGKAGLGFGSGAVELPRRRLGLLHSVQNRLRASPLGAFFDPEELVVHASTR